MNTGEAAEKIRNDTHPTTAVSKQQGESVYLWTFRGHFQAPRETSENIATCNTTETGTRRSVYNQCKQLH